MPRPGPRPYECVKRAWHSETHQLIRGSMVQQILRLAIQTHSSATKKNMEWRDKILIVIVKAEEIMYSKANSEIRFSKSLVDLDGKRHLCVVRNGCNLQQGDRYRCRVYETDGS
uniref:Uncharacterized protein n=1 Tax=Gossypium raimondii TaxID=29730 RepID=A0A0D2VJA6_GOSRA|nr:hypothetical protein B456_013G234700 [Gossypium raimondii]